MLQFLFNKFHGIRQHREHIGSLKIIKRNVIVNAMSSVAQPFTRKCRNSRIMIALPSGYHLSVTVISPDHNYIIRKFDQPLLIKLHGFSIQICAKNRIRNVFFYQVILFLHNTADQLSSLLRSIILGIILPEWGITLASEAKIPDDFMIHLSLYSFLPKTSEQVWILFE